MNISGKKLSFRSVVSLVIGSQIGSGAFLLPASLSLLGSISLFGWLISGMGAILLALIFAELSMRVDQGGGPHIYIQKAFGPNFAFFAAWTYWLISWVSSVAVIVAAVGYLSSIFGIGNPFVILSLEIAILAAMTGINLRGVSSAGSFEVLLTAMKCAPLILIPLVGLFFLDFSHFQLPHSENFSLVGSLNAATLMTFWGFIGLESVTTAAGMIENPKKTIPRAVVFGTLSVAIIYLVNSFVVMGVVPPEVLSKTQAPYVDATAILFGGGWNIAMALIAFIACIGTLNAWVLTSGQIALEAGKQSLFPPLFAKTNRSGAPHVAILIAFFSTVPILALTLTPHIVTQLNAIIDVSVTMFVFIYLFCALALAKILLREKRKSYFPWILIGMASLFCLWILAFISLPTLCICSLFVLSGLPIYVKRLQRIPGDSRD